MIAVALLFGIARRLEVGPGHRFLRIESAVRASRAGDTIEVFPAKAGYSGVALKIETSNLTIEGHGRAPVRLSGTGFDYSGIGAVPRAIIQVDQGGGGATIRNFEFVEAHNHSFNGAGVRINNARGVTVEKCQIHGNDMGIMSAGPHATAQMIVDCHIYANGSLRDPGFNHNLYLGGADVAVMHCEIDHSLTGHNLKSRAHFTLVQDCYVHDSANREFDFVEAAETEAPNSNAAIVNCVIRKDPNCRGNRGTIHFGREKGVRRGTIWLIHDTVITPFASPMLLLSGEDVHAELDDDIVLNPESKRGVLAEATGGAKLESVSGTFNWLDRAYSTGGTRLNAATLYRAPEPTLTSPTFVPRHSPNIGIPDPAYYRDGSGREWEVTPSSTLGARWRPLPKAL